MPEHKKVSAWYRDGDLIYPAYSDRVILFCFFYFSLSAISFPFLSFFSPFILPFSFLLIRYSSSEARSRTVPYKYCTSTLPHNSLWFALVRDVGVQIWR